MRTYNKKSITLKPNISKNDKTLEICRCIDNIVSWIMKGDNGKTAFNKAVGSYGLLISRESWLSLERNLNK